ncbi:MAG: TetR family transcriptional regulator [Actinomycetia bacterium]|nr:TetR family transcriptional regulator [Actinomycetes bacterium]
MTSAAAEDKTMIKVGRRRSAEADLAILDATLDLLGAHGFGGLTVAAVIDRAGVSSATLYRRWPTKERLVAAAVSSLHEEPSATDTGSLAGDIAMLLQEVARSIGGRREGIAEGLAQESRRNPELREAMREKFLAPRLEQLQGILRRAKARGELTRTPDLETALSWVIGPLYHRSFYLDEPLTPAFLRTTAAHVLAGLRGVG